MFIFIAGNHFKQAINVGNKYIKKNQKPIINFAIESTDKSKTVFQEYKNLISNLPNNDFSIAFKLSSVNFDIHLINDVVDICKEKKTKLFIDAENNYYNDKYQSITSELMATHNHSRGVIYKTYQMYRKDSIDVLKSDLQLCKQYNKIFCGKLVRGAYWNAEHKDGHLFTNKQDTDDSYNKGIIEIFNSDNQRTPHAVLATHNKCSAELGMMLNKEKYLFDFAHLQGMREGYYNKFTNNHNVHVYIPYGPYSEMIPYLVRRLYENLDVFKHIF